MMTRYFVQALRAHLRGGRSLFALTAFGVALGVASVLSIQILNLNALGAFSGGVQAISGEADLTVLGRLPTFPEELIAAALAESGVAAAWPLCRFDVALADDPELFLEIVGFDLYAPVRLPVRGSARDASATLTTPGWVAVTPVLAAERGWSVGDAVEVVSGLRRARLVIGALVDFQTISPLASRKLAVMDIAQAQASFGTPGRIQQLDVRAREGTDLADLAARLAVRLGPAVRVVTPEQRRDEAAGLLGAFRLNLTALSFISLFVGAFLVHSSIQASLVRRRGELGLLRSLGATRRQVLSLILAEVLLLGLVGVAVGLPLGYAAAAANLETVSRTVSNLYLLEEIETLRLPAWIFLLAGLIGVGGAVGGALLPALDMSRRDTRSLLAAFTLHERVLRFAGPLFATGGLLLAGAGLWYATLGRDWKPAGFVLAVILLLVVPLVTPWLIRRVAAVARPRGLGIGYSLRSLGSQLQISSFAVAALAVAVSMLVGITLMVGSFRTTLRSWIGSTVRADIYVSARSWSPARSEATLDDALVARLAGHPGVVAVDRLRQMRIQLDGRPTALGGIDMGLPGGEVRYQLLEGDPGEAARRARDEGAALISEPLARRLDLVVGDALVVPGPSGPVTLPVAGVFHDYGNENGSILVDLATLEERFGPGSIHSAALYLEPGRDVERVVDEIRSATAPLPLRIRSNRRLRREVLAIFEQTFAVTRLLQGMALLIAVCGITLTLLVMARERVSELALYRALGARRRQIFRIFLGKGLGMAALGIALGAGVGILLALILVFGINRAYFGWTIRMAWPWASMIGQAAMLLAAAAMASIYPAARASRTPATELSHEEVA